MNAKYAPVVTAMLLAVLAGSPLPAVAGIKCWTNKDGVRECGNAVPPEYAQQKTEVKDAFGVTVKESGPAKTIEELEAERATEQARMQEARAAKEREKRDRVLLDTFASEDDLVLTRDGQIAHLDSQIRLTQSHIDKLIKNLDRMIERAAEAERKGDEPSADLTDNIASLRAQIAENEEFIATKHQEQEAIRARFDADIARFRELKGGSGKVADHQ
jgi:chromosome segregation ATPase